MSYASVDSQATTPRKRNLIPYLAGGCAAMGLCALCALTLGGGIFYFSRSTVASVSPPSVEYILDATQRMAQKANGENDTRLNVARGVLSEIVRPSDPAVTAGLRVFGSGAQPAACSDTSLLVPLAPASQTQISAHLLAITHGSNPDAAMSQAMISAIRDLAALKGKHTLVVVTGGADSCNPQASELIASEAQKAAIDLKLFMVGFQVPESDGNAIKGVVDAAGGSYISADTRAQLIGVLNSIQTYVQDQKSTTVSGVLGTAAAVVGTQNVNVAGTVAPTVTAASTTSPSASGTPEASGTAGPTSTPAPVSTQGATQASLTGQTLCDHPYFPLHTGASWNFSSNLGPVHWNVSSVTGDQTEAVAAMQFTDDRHSGTYNWHCTAAGIESYDFNGFTGGGGGVQVTQHSGIWLPPVDRLVPGASWDNAYTLAGTAAGTKVTETFKDHFTLVGTEPHDVGGKTMDALHIETSGSVDVQGLPVGGGSFTTSATYYLVRGIGPVGVTYVFAGISSDLSLTSYTTP